MARVHGKKFRPIDVNNRLHRLGNLNTTGCHGTVSTWNVRVSHGRKGDPNMDIERAGNITVTTGMPGRRRALKRKRTSKMFPGSSRVIHESAVKKQLYNLRADMHTAAILGNLLNRQILPENVTDDYNKITHHLLVLMTPGEKASMDRADVARFYSVKGMVDKGQMGADPIRKLWDRIKRAMVNIDTPIFRKSENREFKPEPSSSFYIP